MIPNKLVPEVYRALENIVGREWISRDRAIVETYSDACDCESDFDCSGGVDAEDVTAFLVDVGRSTYNNPCTNGTPCNGDFNCDGNVDALDVSKFLEDFGRSQFFNSCPPCVAGNWCLYPRGRGRY